ncbi:amidohydrolase family protein [Actinosynnema sp. NPDC023587]|uniref:amidohydrolase family protein n=1 Tax=Actinosynnema sp. NPDC023587 TaxID=3154695 RepID=UPI0033D8335E
MSGPRAVDLQVDFPFDYAEYVSGGRRIGRLPAHALGSPVAVVGAGGSGLTAAYELLRIGCRPIVYEAETAPDGPGGRRLGGRMFSRRLAPSDSAVVELGCMRFPESARLLRHYTDEFGLRWRPFRDEYVADVTPRTVLDLDGTSYSVGKITDLYSLYPRFGEVHRKWEAALHRIGVFELQEALVARDRVRARRLWSDLVHRFEEWTFHRFLRDPGGVGLSRADAHLLGTTNVATTVCDSFFDLSFLETLRMVLTTEGASMHLLQDGIGAVADGFWNRTTTGPDGEPTSLAEVNGGAPRPAVTALEVGADHAQGVVVHCEDGTSQWYPAAVFTPQLHILETSVELRPLNGVQPLGPRLRQAIRRLSYWQSAKTVLVTRSPFWEGTRMDGVTITDRLPRATYTIDYGEPPEPGGRRGVLVLSFTWAEDSMKLATSTVEERVAVLVRELADIHPEVADELRAQAENAQACTISWENQRNFRGFCRFARPGEYTYQWDLFANFVKDFAGPPAVPGEPATPLFLAGDDVAWSPGWLDHAMSSGINAAWGVLRCLGGRTLPDNPGPGDAWQRAEFRPLSPAEAVDRPAGPSPSAATPRRDVPTEQVVIADRLWDGERMHIGARVLVRQGRIEQVGPDVPVPPDAEVVELPGHTLLPGLIDCHVHVVDEQLHTASHGEQTLRALPALRTLLDNGFTTVRDLGTADSPITVDLRQAVRDGVVLGPRLIVAPNIISARGGHGDKEPDLTTRFGLEVGTVADGVVEVVQRVRSQARVGADWIKFAASGGFASPSDRPSAVTYDQAEMDALVSAATDLGLPCAAHAFGDEAVQRAVRAGVRSVEHANLAGADTFALLAERGVYLVPTLQAMFHFIDRMDDEEFWRGTSGLLRAKFSEFADEIRASARHLADSEVLLALGSDASMLPYEETWREFTAMRRVGIAPDRVLKAATSVAADLLDRPELGRVRPGAVADLVAVPGDPLDDMAVMGQVDFILQGGIRRDRRRPTVPAQTARRIRRHACTPDRACGESAMTSPPIGE